MWCGSSGWNECRAVEFSHGTLRHAKFPAYRDAARETGQRVAIMAIFRAETAVGKIDPERFNFCGAFHPNVRTSLAMRSALDTSAAAARGEAGDRIFLTDGERKLATHFAHSRFRARRQLHETVVKNRSPSFTTRAAGGRRGALRLPTIPHSLGEMRARQK